jgi:hypothetical protein
MVPHQDPGVEDPMLPPDDRREQLQEFATVVVVDIDAATFIAAAGDVPDGTWKFES